MIRILVVALVLAGAAPAIAVPPPALAGRTVVRASRPVVMDVRLAKAATVRTPLGQSADVTVRGGGRLALAALVGTGGAAAGTTLVAGRFPGPDAPPFAMPVARYPAPPSATFEIGTTFPETTTLPAGSYRLYVVPDGAAAEFSLRLGGLAGAVTIAPTRPARADLSLPAMRVAGTAPANSATAGTRLTGPGLGLQALWLDTAAHAAAQYSLCHRAGEAAVEPADAVHGCPLATLTFVNDRKPTPGRDEKLLVQGLAHLPAGDHGLGMSYTAQSVVSDARYAVLWLTF